MSARTTITIGLLRHGETEGGARYRGRTDDRLTETGWRQMRSAVADTSGWEKVVTSSLARCAAFAQAYAIERRLPLRVDERLREIDFGDWEGRSAAEIMETSADALLNFWQDPWKYGPPAGEPLAQMSARVLAAWHDLIADTHTTLVVGHGGPMRVILCHALGLPLAQLLHVEVAPATLHRVTVCADGTCLVEAPLP
ncbi:MAG: histidine phosphatase family protein [Sulfurifustis sp.]